MKCKYCQEKCVKDGFQKNGIQRYKYKKCNRKQQRSYTYSGYCLNINQSIIQYTKEGAGIRGTARLVKISTTTLLSRIISIAKNISQPIITSNQVYEVDEIKSFIKRKKNRIWIVYALNRKTKEVVSYRFSKSQVMLSAILKIYFWG